MVDFFVHGDLTRAAWGVPNTLEQGGKISSGPQMGRLATLLLQYGGVPNASRSGT